MAPPLVGRGDAGFEEARVARVSNRRLTDRQPAAVVRPETEAEVVAAMADLEPGHRRPVPR